MRKILLSPSLMVLASLAGPTAQAANYRGFIPENEFGQLYVYDWSTPALTGFVAKNGTLGCAWGLAFSADSSRLFVANCTDGKISVLDTDTLAYLNPPIDVGAPVVYLAAGPTGRYLYATTPGALKVIDLTGALPMQTIALTANPFRIAVTPDNAYVVVSFHSPLAAVIRIASPHTVKGYVPLTANPADVAVSPDSQRAVLPVGGGISNINLGTLAKTDWPIAACAPNSVAFSPAGTRLYVACTTAPGARVLHGVTGAAIASGTLPATDYFGPRTVSVAPDGREVWFPGEPYGNVHVLDAATLLPVAFFGGSEHANQRVVFGQPLHEWIDRSAALASVTAGREAAPAACAPGQIYRVTAWWRNGSVKAWKDMMAEVLALTGGHTLIEQTWDLTADGIVNPGELAKGVFRIRLANCTPFSFQVSLTAITSTPTGGPGFAHRPVPFRPDLVAPMESGENGSSLWRIDPLE